MGAKISKANKRSRKKERRYSLPPTTSGGHTNSTDEAAALGLGHNTVSHIVDLNHHAVASTNTCQTSSFELSSCFSPTRPGEEDRLNAQQFAIKTLFGGNILDKAYASLTADPDRPVSVLDVGTGSGSYVMDLATEYPEWTCVGFDKTPTFPQTIRPSNTEFLSGNILSGLPFPDDSFDFVQMRAFVMVFTKEDWTQALKEVYRVLKPGGWIQLLEPEVMTSGNEIIQKFSNDLKNLMDEAGVDPYVCEKLSLMLRDTNFNVMQEERRSVRLNTSTSVANEFLFLVGESIEACRPFLNGLYNFQSEQDFEFWKAQYTKAQKDTSEAVWYAAAAQKPL